MIEFEKLLNAWERSTTAREVQQPYRHRALQLGQRNLCNLRQAAVTSSVGVRGVQEGAWVLALTDEDHCHFRFRLSLNPVVARARQSLRASQMMTALHSPENQSFDQVLFSGTNPKAAQVSSPGPPSAVQEFPDTQVIASYSLTCL